MTTTALEPLEAQAKASSDGLPDRRRLKLPLAPSLERRRLQCYLMLILLEGISIIGALLAVGQVYLHDATNPVVVAQITLILPFYWTAAIVFRAYSVRSLTSIKFAQSRVLLALFAAFTVLVFFVFFAGRSAHYMRGTIGVGAVGASVVLCWVRAMAQPLVRMGCGPTAENVLVIDDGGTPVKVEHAWHINAREYNLSPDRTDPHMLDRLGLFMTNMDRVLVTCPAERRADWAMVLKGSNVCGEIVEPVVEALGVLGARRGFGFGALVVSAGPLSLRDRAAKRAIDVAIAGGALLMLSPLLLTVAIMIRLEDRGPVFFMQKRQGRNNRLFRILKFRSMRVEKLDATGACSASKDDDRITRIGRIIRRTSIDETPQLINVLRGDMSIVGPRPHAIGSLAGKKRFWEVDSRYLLRHSLKPGLTGLAQVRGFRGATDTEKDLSSRLQADLEYIDGWTVLRDVRIMFATLKVLVHDRAF